jgi:FtsH-binding integral membrane protein
MLANHILLRTSIRTFKQKPKAFTETVAKPIKYGLGFVGVSSAAGLAYTLKNAYAPKATSNLNSVAVWPDYVAARINGTFKYVLGGLGMTTLGAMATLRSPVLMSAMNSNSMFAFFGCMAAIWGTGTLVHSIKFDGSAFGPKSLAYYLHMAVVGAIIAPITLVGGQACLYAAGLTAAVMAGLSVTAMVAPSDAYMKTYGIVNAGMFLMLGACVMTFFINPVSAGGSALSSFIVFGGLGLFGLKGFSDVNRCIDQAKRPGQFDPVNNAVHISMDAVNIFIRLAMLMGGNKRK